VAELGCAYLIYVIFTGPSLDNAIDIIHKESLRLRNVVENMIDITILDQPHDIYFLPNDLSYIIDQVIETVGGYALDRKVELRTNIDLDTWVSGDWDQLHSMFVNLLSNAIRHADGLVVIDSKLIENDSKVLIRVQDDGSGFSPEDLEHCFDYFYTGAKSGSGLGLTIVKKIIEAHSGRINIYNSDQSGAIVEVILTVAS
jgi:Signal transduction histidine kinase